MVRFVYVRAHVGEPGNETADALAKAAVEKAWMMVVRPRLCSTMPVICMRRQLVPGPARKRVGLMNNHA